MGIPILRRIRKIGGWSEAVSVTKSSKMNIQKILVGVDFSCHDAGTLEFATSLARQHGASIDVVHVVEPLSAYFGQAYWGAAIEDEKQRYEQLHSLQLSDPTIPMSHVMLRAETTGLTTSGDIAHELVEYAKQQHCDLIVLSSHGRSGVMAKLFGGVTEAVMRLATTAVLVVKG
jgi:universal stress protein A